MEPSRPPFNHDRVQDHLSVVRQPELLRAASSGDLPLLEEFLKHGQSSASLGALPRDVDIHVEEAAAAAVALSLPAAATDGASALHVAAASGDHRGYLELAEIICGKAPELLLACDGNGDTPLHCAVRAGNVKMASLLIDQANGCDEKKMMVRMTNKRGETALHEAVRLRQDTGLRMVKALMLHDKELARVVARDGTSPLYLAVSLHHGTIVSELISKDSREVSYSGPLGQNALHPAVLRSKKMTRELLIKWKTELTKQQDLSGSTPTHFAASADDPSLEFFLYGFMERTLEFYSLGIYFAPSNWLTRFYSFLNLPLYQLVRADPSAAFQRDNDGLFPVHVAASAGNLVAVIILLTLCRGCSGLRDSL